MCSYSRIIMFTVTAIAGTSLTPALSEEKRVLPWTSAVLSSCCVPGNRVSLGHGPALCCRTDRCEGNGEALQGLVDSCNIIGFYSMGGDKPQAAVSWLHCWQTLRAPWGIDHLQGSLQPRRSKETQEEAPARIQREMMVVRATAGEVAC